MVRRYCVLEILDLVLSRKRAVSTSVLVVRPNTGCWGYCFYLFQVCPFLTDFVLVDGTWMFSWMPLWMKLVFVLGCLHLEKLDDGWPESAEEHVALVLL